MDKAAFTLFENTDNRPKFPYGEGTIGPWKIVFSNGRRFLFLGIIFSALLSLAAIAMGKAFVCNYAIYGSVNFYCKDGNTLSLFYFAIKLLILAAFIYLWTNYGSDKLTEKKSAAKQIGLISAILLTIFIAILCPLISFMVLSERVPNPDWRIEAAFFTFVSVGFLVPIAMMRCLMILGFALEGKKLPSLKVVWQYTSGNMMRIIFTLFTIMLVYVFIYGNFYGNFRRTDADVLPIAGIVIELLYNFITLFFFTLFANNTLLQKRYLYDESAIKD